MLLSITKAVSALTRKHFENLLLAGAFPKINYSRNERGWISYSMFEYSNTYARFMKLVDERVKVDLDPHLGVFTRKHSKAFLSELEKVLATIGEKEIENHGDRFRSFADAVIEEAMK